MTTLNLQVSSDNDDAYEWEGDSTVYGISTNTDTDDYMSSDATGGDQDWAGFRFQNVTVPQGATINSATLTFTAKNSVNETSFRGRVYGDDVDDAPAWGASDSPKDVTTTTASTNWDPAAWVVDTEYGVTVTSIIQEIVNRGGWASGQDLRLVVHPDADSGGWVSCYDYNGSSAKATKLDIDYTVGGISVPVAYHQLQQQGIA